MIQLAKVLAMVGTAVALIGGLVEGGAWIAGGGALLAVALVLGVVRAIATGREPPPIPDVLDAADGAEDPRPNHSEAEAKAVLGDRGVERAPRVGGAF